MGRTTGIEWTDSTWNPIRGCSRVSEGCRNCYAERTAARFSGKGQPYEGLAEIKNIRRPNGQTETTEARWTGAVQFVEKHLEDPLRWKAPKKIFVNSMSDLFHEAVEDDWLIQIFTVMQACPQHTFQILTKRPERMLAWMTEENGDLVSLGGVELAGQKGWCHAHEDGDWPLKNVWLGTSVEDQQTANARIPFLVACKAPVRFISYEPAIGPVDFTHIDSKVAVPDSLCAGGRPLNPINWVICGGESGSKARPMHPDWARAARSQCLAAGVPFFFKQWGEWSPTGPTESRQCAVSESGKTAEPIAKEKFPFWCQNESWQVMYHVGKNADGSQLDGFEWKEFPKGGNK